MRTPSSPAVANDSVSTFLRAFRADRVPVPEDLSTRLAGLRLSQAIARGGPIDLEIGCGVGWHPIRYARENPGRTVVAIERTAEKFAKFRERLARHPELTNLIAVHADAVAWITHFAPPGTFDRLFLLYPNPNPKNPAARWVRMPFFGRLLESLRPGAEIELRTNVEAYAEEAAREAADRWGLRDGERHRFTRAEVYPANARTHFERKYLERGEACFSLRWRI
ncbi:MAG: hypothetical protein JST04_07805 [Bdellovibrionales bacterium]|nr:hypothetical protein [Bdellovibrionales bacterium]